MNACSELLSKGIHPTVIADAFKQAAAKAEEILIGKIFIDNLGIKIFKSLLFFYLNRKQLPLIFYNIISSTTIIIIIII